MDKSSSIVKVDKRHHRKIAQDNWGLTDEQMKGMHVHHRIHRSKGGTNDPSNLYVCSPWFHQHQWHNGEEWVAWSKKGSELGVKASALKRKTDPDWAAQEKERTRQAARLSHSKHAGTKEYSERQRKKSLRANPLKRVGWTEEVYDNVWGLYLKGVTTGYRIGKRLGDPKWKRYANMLKYAELGFSFEQLVDVEKYINEVERLKESPLSEVLGRYN